MKLTLTALFISLMSASAFADQIRDTKISPLTATEKSALRAASSLAKELGQKVHEECVNAAFAPGNLPVHVQFYKTDEDGPYCVDSHYSITVNFNASGTITSLEVLDN